MDFITIISALLRLVGLAEWFEGYLQKRHAKAQAQAVANTPATNQEWTNAAEKGDL